MVKMGAGNWMECLVWNAFDLPVNAGLYSYQVIATELTLRTVREKALYIEEKDLLIG